VGSARGSRADTVCHCCRASSVSACRLHKTLNNREALLSPFTQPRATIGYSAEAFSDSLLEDKIVQQAVVSVLSAIYESDFLGFSYGFRPGRGPHDALDALAVGLVKQKVWWGVDAGIH